MVSTMSCSLYINQVGDSGGAAIGDALQDNAALTELRWVAPFVVTMCETAPTR